MNPFPMPMALQRTQRPTMPTLPHAVQECNNGPVAPVAIHAHDNKISKYNNKGDNIIAVADIPSDNDPPHNLVIDIPDTENDNGLYSSNNSDTNDDLDLDDGIDDPENWEALGCAEQGGARKRG